MGEIWIVPSFFNDDKYFTIYDQKTQKNITFLMDEKILFNRMCQTSREGFFIPISAYSLVNIFKTNKEYIYQNNLGKGKTLLELVSGITENDNTVLVQFDWDMQKIQEYF